MDFTGIIIEESLVDRSLLKQIEILSTTIEEVTSSNKTPWLKQWTLHEVKIPKEKATLIADELSQVLDPEHNWYADYKTNFEHFIIYRGKVFHITDRGDKRQYEEATQYGIKMGIPSYQVDFSPFIKQWNR